MDKGKLSLVLSKNYFYVALILLIVVIAFFVYGSFLLKYKNMSPGENLSDNNNNNINQNYDDRVVVIEEPEVYTYEEVIEMSDISKCDKVEEKYLIESCKLKLMVCDEGDDKCIFDKAVYERDLDMCDRVLDEVMKEDCKRIINHSVIVEKSVLNDDIGACDEFEDAQDVLYCKNNFYYVKSLNEEDKSYCNQIIDEVMKNGCLEEN